jgi:hypothetical protein
MFCYYTPNKFSIRDSVFAYPKGEGFSFYSKNRQGQKFLRWFKGNKEEVCAKMDKFFNEY